MHISANLHTVENYRSNGNNGNWQTSVCLPQRVSGNRTWVEIGNRQVVLYKR
jgi:hypothetical protein